MATSLLKQLLAFVPVLLLLGCATSERIVLLPEPGGAPSAVVIYPRQGGEVSVDSPYSVVAVSDRRAKVQSSDEATVKARYKSVMEALPERARAYTLNFEFGKTQLTGESKTLLEAILQEVQKLPVPELTIIGHTDDVGSEAANEKLSLERARNVLAMIKAKGIEPKNIVVVGRGKRELLYATRPGVPDHRNRRVEIRIK